MALRLTVNNYYDANLISTAVAIYGSQEIVNLQKLVNQYLAKGDTEQANTCVAQIERIRTTIKRNTRRLNKMLEQFIDKTEG